MVAGVLEDHTQRLVDGRLVEGPGAERDEGARPVDGLRDRGGLAQLHVAQLADHLDDLTRQPFLDLGHLRDDDLALALCLGVVDVQEQAPPLDRLGELTRGVGGEYDERPTRRRDRTHLGDGHLEVAEHLEQQALDLDVGLVDLVDQQHRRLLAPDRGQQRPGEQELVGEDVVVGLVPRLVTSGLDPQQLLLVVPLVERPGLVETLVALEPDQLRARRAGDRLGQLGLAHTCRPLDEQWLLQRSREVGRRGRRRVGEVPDRGQLLLCIGRGLEPHRLLGGLGRLLGHPVIVPAAPAGRRRGPPGSPAVVDQLAHALVVDPPDSGQELRTRGPVTGRRPRWTWPAPGCGHRG